MNETILNGVELVDVVDDVFDLVLNKIRTGAPLHFLFWMVLIGNPRSETKMVGGGRSERPKIQT